jgi:hypothetical protein
MHAFAADFARACGYSGDSPALLEAFEAIRRNGIALARHDHFRRKAVIDALKQSEALFLAAIGPALSAQEAIEDATASSPAGATCRAGARSGAWETSPGPGSSVWWRAISAVTVTVSGRGKRREGAWQPPGWPDTAAALIPSE